MKNLSSLAFATVALLFLAGAASAQSEAAGVALTTEEATAFIKGKAIRLHAWRAGRLRCSSKTTARCMVTTAAVIQGSGELKTESCA